MRIRLNRFAAFLLLLLLLPIRLPIKLYRWVTGTGKRAAYVNTIEGDPLDYLGERPLVVAFWTTWASIWFISSGEIVRGLQREFAGRCEFAYIELAKRTMAQRYNVDVIPTILVLHNGQEVGRFVNLLEADELRACIVQRVVA